jgi:uncharacterized repeat protein (TIGR01451 family)
MKRTLVALPVFLAITAMAFQRPQHESLPNFDRRAGNAAAIGKEIAPEHQAGVNDLKARVPQLEVTRGKVLNHPDFFSSRDGFLTGPQGQGKGVRPELAQGIPQDDRHRGIKAFLNEHSALFGYGAEALNGARISREHVGAHNGLRTTVWHQELNGIPLFECITMGHITKNGELVNLYTHFVPKAQDAAAAGLKGRSVAASINSGISAAEAIAIGARNIGDTVVANELAGRGAPEGTIRKQVFRGAGGLKGDQYVELVWLPLNETTLRLCWQVVISSRSHGEMYQLLVDVESGEVHVRRCLTHYITNATYNVYTSDSPSPFSPGYQNPGNPQQPLVVPRTLVTLPALNTNASPNGWINDGVNETTGNNVDAHADRNDDDQPDLPRPAGTPFRVFDFPLDLTQDPTNYTPAAVVNLFYWNNVIHDKFWELGFTEAAGNFQVNNFGRGGVGNDPVLADAQDGADFKDIFHTDNANMATPPDGIPPRMQMYVFAGPAPDRDGDVDSEVMIHEYTHGLSNRRVGGGVLISALQTAGMGEGWGDFYGLSLLSETNDAIDGAYAMGGYVTYQFVGLPFTDNYYFGIRHFPYTTNLLKNPFTFKDIDPNQISPHVGVPRSPVYSPFNRFEAPEVHHQGEIWCSMLFEVRANLIAKYGHAVGNQRMLLLVTDAMALCPPNPNFIQSRDAILLADRINNANANYNEIWLGFAKRGLGANATSPDSSTTQGVFESFDLPGLQITSISVSETGTGNGNGVIDFNECVEVFIAVRNNGVVVATNITGVLTSATPGVVVVQSVSAYPDLPPTASAQNLIAYRLYTQPDFVCGTPIDLVLQVTDFAPAFQLATNRFRLRSGFVALTPILRNNNIPVAIPDFNTNGVDSTINVSGFSGALGKITVSTHITHTFDADLVIQLIAPDGTVVSLSKNQGVAGDNFGTSCSPLSARTTFDDNAPASLAGANAPFVGNFRPDEPLDLFTGKSGASVNGTWRLRVIDAFAQDVGAIQCWTLSLYPTVCQDGGGQCSADVAVRASTAPNPPLSGYDLTYSLTVTNHRPVLATNVMFTNIVPPQVSFVSVTSTVGTCVFTNGEIICALGDFAATSNAVITVVVQPISLGTFTNVFTAFSGSSDGVLSNNVAAVASTVIEALPSFVAAGVQIIGESFAPATGGIESGETVTLAVTLRNVGTAPSGNLLATLLEGNGVASPSGPQNYGVVAVGGTETRTFSFTAPGAHGSSVNAVLALQDGAHNLGTLSFSFTVGGEIVFANPAPIVINTLGAASPYPATINVSGLNGVVGSVRVSFIKLAHTYPDDIDALLVGPRGQKLLLMSDAGGGNSISNRTITFDGAAATLLPNESVINAGSYLPTDYVSGTEPAGDVFPAPAPVGPLSSSLTAFNSTDPNGTWSLFIHDDGGNDAGVIAGGWSLSINTVAPVNPVAELGVTAAISPPAPIAGETFTITLTVLNNGPSNATSVILNDVLPVGMAAASASVSQGTVTIFDGTLTANLGTISNGASAAVSIQLQPNSPGLRTNIATVSAASTDLNASNNVATTAFTVGAPLADLGLRVVASPSPVFVTSNVTFTAVITNVGPNHAETVRLTNRLSAGLEFVSATGSQGSCSFVDGVVICQVGDIDPHSSATVSIVATALSPGTVANLFAVLADFPDVAPANNTTNVLTTIAPLAPVIVTSGVALTGENPGPANGSLDSGESVTVSFGLRNAGTAPTANLVATLQASGGVVSPTGPQNYGVLNAGGATVARPFSFVVGGAPGTVLTGTLQLQDGAQDLGTVSFAFTVSASRSFTNNNVIIIPLQGQATNYPSTLTVSGVTGSVSKVTVTLRQLTHSYPEDIDMLLVSPAGQKVLLMSDAGAGNGINNVTLTLDDSAGALPFATAIASGTYHATDYAPGDTFPAPAPGGPYGTNLSAFNGASPNGVWSLYVFDDAVGDAGRIDGGWTLNIQTASPVMNAADVAVTATAPASVESGEPFTYSITVVNHGPATATAVTLSDPLPPTFAVTGVTVSQGSFSTSPTAVTANLGTLNAGASAVMTISGTAVGPRSITNVLSVAAAQLDPHSANNTAALVTTVAAPVLAIRQAGTNAVITWRSPATGYTLESSTNVLGTWAPAGLPVINANGTNSVTVPAIGTKFYRLQK